MSYIANSARVSSLTIDGIDYTDAFVSFTAQDASAIKNGCVTTSGTVVLGTKPGTSLESYDRLLFRRGQPVVLDMESPAGGTYRHPRGLLYVVAISYSPEDEIVEIGVTCKIGLAALTGNVEALLALSPIDLEVTQQQFSNIAAAFASAGKIVYQDNQGALQVVEFFGGDLYDSVTAGDWLSVDSVTAMSVAPLQGTDPVPDIIKLQYQIPRDEIATDQFGRIDTTTVTSNYFVQYPSIIYTRKKPPEEEEGEGTSLANQDMTTVSRPPKPVSSCGNEPPEPGDAGQDEPVQVSCTEQYESTKTNVYVPVTKTEVSTTYYSGPAGQISKVESSVTGPMIEVNSQYYSDIYTYCRALYASKCEPNGGCPMNGLNNRPMGRTVLTYNYGAAGELVKTIQDTYALTLSAAQTDDWRSGDGKSFRSNLSETTFFLAQRVIEEYYKEGNTNVQLSTTWTSAASRNVGLKGNLDALSGIKTTQKRVSTTTSTLDVSPDRVNTPATDTEFVESDIVLFTGRYVLPPAESGPYVVEEQIPVPLLFNSSAQINEIVTAYENYITRMYKGEAFGLQIGEVLRDDIATGWAPNMPFRYYDVAKGELLAMRMDGTTWDVSGAGSLVVTNALWIGKSNGTPQIPSNLVGNSLPDMGSGGTTPPATVPPSVEGETSVDSGSFAFVVNVDLNSTANMGFYGDGDGVLAPLPADTEYVQNLLFFVYAKGFISAPGSLSMSGPNGYIPVELAGQLLTETATVINADLFAPVGP